VFVINASNGDNKLFPLSVDPYLAFIISDRAHKDLQEGKKTSGENCALQMYSPDGSISTSQ